MRKLFLSHRLESLVEHLYVEMAQDGLPPLSPRTILVPTSLMKQWLLLQCVQWSEEKGLAGCKIYSVEDLLPASSNFTQIFCHLFIALTGSSVPPELSDYVKGGMRRVLDLSERLACLFLSYGKEEQFDLCQVAPDHWQTRLWPLGLFGKQPIAIDTPIHCFGFDFLSQTIWKALSSAPSLSVYLFSPCSYYWEDTCSDWERRKLGRYWKQKGASALQREELDQYLRKTPTLLGNWGKLGREHLKVLDPFDWEIIEEYAESDPTSNLQRLQKRLLHFEIEEEKWPADDSCSIVQAGASRLQEIETLRHSILELLEKENLRCSDIAVLAPDIREYAPLIECIFSDLPYRIYGVEIRSKSFFYQGMERLFTLISEDWNREALLDLFENPSFCRAQKWDEETLELFRDFLSSQKEGQRYEEVLLATQVFLFPNQMPPAASPEKIEKWINALCSLRLDLSQCKEVKNPLGWAKTLRLLMDKYLSADLQDEADAAAWNGFQQSMKELSFAPDHPFPFAAIRKLLQRPSPKGQIHPSHLHAIRFASFEEGVILPSRALFLIGMDEESFPRRNAASSLDLLRHAKFYLPNSTDRDRYLFLQAIFATREFLQISYRHLTPDEGKSVNPSFLVEELRQFLNAPFQEKKRASPLPIQSFSFPWPEHPSQQMPKGEVIIPIAELKELAAHPWRFYLKKKWGIRLEERQEASFSMQKGKVLRASLQDSSVLEEELAPGLCGEALKIELLKGASLWQERISSWGATLEPLSFQLKRQTKKWTEEGWELPALEISLNETLRVKLVGEIKLFSSTGFLYPGEDSLDGALKAWPEWLIGAVALQRKEIHFLKNGRSRTVEKPEEALRAFLHYYFLSISAPSPLLNDWATPFLLKSPEDVEKKMRDRMAGKGVRFDDPVFDWVISRALLPSADRWWQSWAPLLKDHFSHLTTLYPPRGSRASV